MAIRVFTVPQPAVGHDWTVTIPGQWNVALLAVTATIVTPYGLNTFADTSGHGRNATISGTTNQPGASGPYSGGAGNFGVNLPQAFTPQANYSSPVNGDFTIECWEFFRGGTGGSGSFYRFLVGASGGNISFGFGYYFGGLNPGHGWTDPQDLATDVGIFVENIVTGFMPLNGWHHFAARSDHLVNGGRWDVFLDGIQTGTNLDGNHSGIATAMTLGGSPQPNHKQAGVAVFDTALQNATILSHSNALATAADYSAAVLLSSPTGLWMLNDTGAEGTRKVDLVLTDGTAKVGDFPASFPNQTVNSATWSWQVLGSGALASSDGTANAVPIPELYLPPGYTVGTRTLDLAATDQWQNITLYFDDGTGENPTDQPGFGPDGYLNAMLVPEYPF